MAVLLLCKCRRTPDRFGCDERRGAADLLLVICKESVPLSLPPLRVREIFQYPKRETLRPAANRLSREATPCTLGVKTNRLRNPNPDSVERKSRNESLTTTEPKRPEFSRLVPLSLAHRK
jgi:hypothetical protein